MGKPDRLGREDIETTRLTIMSNKTPTLDDLRQITHKGFVNSLSHLPADRRERITKSYATQELRRVNNRLGFRGKVLGAGK